MIKSIELFLFILILLPFKSIFPQYFVDHDKVKQVWQQNLKGYWTKPEEIKNKNIWLEAIHRRRNNYISDIKIGFDKLEYKSDDWIIVTLDRGYKSETDSELVNINACDEIFSTETKVQKYNYEPAPYFLYLRKGEKVKINLRCKEHAFLRLGFTFGPSMGPHTPESRSYIINYTNKINNEAQEDSVSGNTIIIRKLYTVPGEMMKVPTIKEEEIVK